MRVAGRGYRDGVRNLEVTAAESLSGGSRPNRQEEGRVMELIFCLSVLGSRGERRTG